MSNEAQTGWVIELGKTPTYWDGRGPGTFTTFSQDAVRFARKEDAERARVRVG